MVVQGVKPDEDAGLSTMWTLLGYPPTGVAVPLWVDERLPDGVRLDNALSTSPFSYYSLRLKDKVFGLKWGMGSERYLHWTLLYDRTGKGYMQRLAPAEERIRRQAESLLEKWRRKGHRDRRDMRAFYDSLAKDESWNLFNELYNMNQ